MKAQSDLAGDRKSAAEMTAPRFCGVTKRIGHNDESVPEIVKPVIIELPDLTGIGCTAIAHHVADSIDSFLEVNRLPPPAAMPVLKPR